MMKPMTQRRIPGSSGVSAIIVYRSFEGAEGRYRDDAEIGGEALTLCFSLVILVG